jgi:hypothetical protein
MIVLANERGRDRLEAARSWTKYLDALRLSRPALGGKHRDDRDAVQLEIGLDT